MLISELPYNYQDLARKRIEEDRVGKQYEGDNLQAAFPWHHTPEGRDFWEQCSLAQHKEELPDIDSDMKEQESGDITIDKSNKETKELLLL